MKTRPSNEELFWSRVPERPEDPDACWRHTGSKGSHGYPQIYIHRKKAHQPAP